MNKSVTFTVVIPLFNKEKEISRALCSVLHQTNQSFEIIVVDDGSEDHGSEVVNSIIDPRIRLIQQKNLGVSAARNRGIQESRGELIAFLDADDEWHKNYLETIIHLQKKYPEAGIFATCYQAVFGGVASHSLLKGLPENFEEGLLTDYFRLAALGAQLLWTSSVSVPKRVLADVGGFSVGENLGEDLDLWCRIALDYKIALSSQKCALYHQDAGDRLSSHCVTARGLLVVKTAQAALNNSRVLAEMIPGLKCYITRCQIFSLRQRMSHGGLIQLFKYLVERISRPNVIQSCFYLLLALMPIPFIEIMIKRKLDRLEKNKNSCA